MHAVTGPYARAILVDELGAPAEPVINATPLPDFGGGHPDPNLVYSQDLFDLMMGPDAPDLGAASDGDGDRNLIIGTGRFVTPSDSLAMLAANAHLAPGYAAGSRGSPARCRPARAADRVAAKLGIGRYETPTGWKFFGTLLDAGMATLCGEESAGTGSNHVREKDGLWAVLLWLNVLAARRSRWTQIVREHWRTTAATTTRATITRRWSAEAANGLMAHLRGELAGLPGTALRRLTVGRRDEFAYTDPVDGSVHQRQGIRVLFEDGSRVVFRLSGTGTAGATLRVYIERYEPDVGKQDEEVQGVLAPLIQIAETVWRRSRAAPAATPPA